jgi:transcriptional regulator with XRE-family HTH domain
MAIESGSGRNPIDEHVGNRIRQRRLQLGLTKAGLARALGVSVRRIGDYERGIGRVPPARLGALGDILDLRISDFFSGYRPISGPVL